MKSKRQYRDSAMFTIIGYVGIVLVFVTILLGIGKYTGFYKEVQDGINNDPRPANRLMNYECSSLTDSLTNNDEDVMWIGGNGDTIWE